MTTVKLRGTQRERIARKEVVSSTVQAMKRSSEVKTKDRPLGWSKKALGASLTLPDGATLRREAERPGTVPGADLVSNC